MVAVNFVLAAVLATQLEAPRDVRLAAPNRDVATIAEAPAAFEAVALSWWATGACDAPRVRASADGIRWGEWVALPIDEHLTDRTTGRYVTTIAHFGREQRFLDYALACTARDLTATVFPAAAPPVGRETTHGHIGAIRSRTDWGCPDGQGSRWTPAYTTVTHAVVHHTAGANTLPNWDAELRNIWHLHTITNGWGDIGYNYLIDPNGVIYEGRAGGDGAIGAHFSCRNTNTVGVALLGTYTTALPTSAALESLKALLADLMRRHGLSPTAVVRHVPSGLDVPTIIGHRDGNSSPLTCSRTACPGDAFYPMLPAIRTEVANACVPPAIVEQPASRSVAPGEAAVLSVGAGGTEPLSYQWYAGVRGNTDAAIAGGNAATVTVSPASTWSYWVRLTNACGSADSDAATVTVLSSAARRRATRP